MQLSGLELAETAPASTAANSSGCEYKQLRRFLTASWPVRNSDKCGFAMYGSKTCPERSFGVNQLCRLASTSVSLKVSSWPSAFSRKIL